MKYISRISIAITILLYSSAGFTAVGDYNFFESIGNLIVAPKPDNPPNYSEKNRKHFPLTNSKNAFSFFNPKAYFQWQTITVDEEETGAVCGDGSPFKFVVNRSNLSKNLVIFMEAGGICWDHDTCSGKVPLGADSMSVLPITVEKSVFGDIYRSSSPFTNRFNLAAGAVRNWNMVFIPYCTADIYAGDTTKVYTDENGGDAIAIEHKGMRNIHSVLSWAKNNLERPAQLLVTGRSAGGLGATINYAATRADLAPSFRSYLINDAGPVFLAPKKGDATKYPSVFLHNKVKEAIRFNKGPGKYLKTLVPGFKSNNLGSIYKGLADLDPNDRHGFVIFQKDRTIPAFSYSLFGDKPDTEEQNSLLMKDINRLAKKLDKMPNFGYFLLNHRAVAKSHMAAISYLHSRADIQEQNLDVSHFYSSILSDNGSVMQAREYDMESDYNRPPVQQWIIDVLKRALPGIFGD